MVVDDPNEVRLEFYRLLLNRQVGLIERMLNNLQMKDATPSPPPNTPKTEGKSFPTQGLYPFLNPCLVRLSRSFSGRFSRIDVQDKLIPKGPRTFFSYIIINLSLNYIPSGADREAPRSMVPRKRPREETELSPDTSSTGDHGKLITNHRHRGLTFCLNIAEGEAIRVDSSILSVGPILGTLPDSQSPVPRSSLREQVSDIHYALKKRSAKIRRLFAEQSRLETDAEREYCENGGKPTKPHPHLFTISAELSANMRARDVLNLQLSDLLSGGSDGTASEPSSGSKASNSVRILIIDA